MNENDDKGSSAQQNPNPTTETLLRKSQVNNSDHASRADISVYESEVKDHAVLTWR